MISPMAPDLVFCELPPVAARGRGRSLAGVTMSGRPVVEGLGAKRQSATDTEIREALAEYNRSEEAIDSPLFERFGRRIRQQAWLGPDDLYVLIVWKSVPRFAIRNAREALRRNPPDAIVHATRQALALVAENDSEAAAVEAVRLLTQLPFVKLPIASAILTFYDPTRFGAIDPNAWSALGWPDDQDWGPEDYGRYLTQIRTISRRCGLTPRAVDCALYWIGGK